ncbi:MAG: hypothetical protein AB7H77_09600 [Bdellovibrionales bacterium]
MKQRFLILRTYARFDGRRMRMRPLPGRVVRWRWLAVLICEWINAAEDGNVVADYKLVWL